MAADDARWVVVCSHQRLAERGIVCATVAGISLLVILDGDAIHACERACPHEQADLAQGHVANGGLHCPRHLAWFDLATGAISPGWSSRDLRRYRVRSRDGMISVDRASLIAEPGHRLAPDGRHHPPR